MNILIIENSIGKTGAFNSIFLKTKLLKKNCNFFFAVPKGSSNIEILKNEEINYIEINFKEINRKILNNLLYIPNLIFNTFKILYFIKKNKIDIIHTNDLYNLIGICCRVLSKVKVITHVRRMPESFPYIIYIIWVYIHKLFAHKILAVSNANTNIFNKNNKISILYNPYSRKIEKIYDPCIIDNKLNDTKSTSLDTKLSILYLANYNYGKGQNHAIEVLNILINNRKLNLDFILHFYGDDFGLEINKKFKIELQDLVNNYNLNNFIVFNSASKNVRQTINEFDIMLNLSDSESLSRVTMEALFYKKPIIATNVGGTNEMIENNINGYLVEKFDYNQMADYLFELITSKNKRAYFINNSDFTLNKFEPNLIANQLLNIYKEVLKLK
jgi:glycosyltransferase involved in cell wall biosynthesis